jgi:hypothetical protein
MAQAKITVSAAQADKIGLLTAHLKPVSKVIFDPKSGVNLRYTPAGEFITVPDGADLTNLKAFENQGYFTVIEGEINTQAAPIFQKITVGGAENKTLTLVFSEPIYTSALSSTGLGQDTDDMVILVDGTATAFTVSQITKANATANVVITMGTAPTSSVSVKITATGAAKIKDLMTKPMAAAVTRTYSLAATDFTTFTFADAGLATINGLDHTIGIEVDAGTEVTALVATFTLSPGATVKVGETSQVSGTTANDFTSPVTYTVTAQDGTTTQAWTVTVTVAS